jgi:hypothetical protein
MNTSVFIVPYSSPRTLRQPRLNLQRPGLLALGRIYGSNPSLNSALIFAASASIEAAIHAV